MCLDDNGKGEGASLGHQTGGKAEDISLGNEDISFGNRKGVLAHHRHRPAWCATDRGECVSLRRTVALDSRFPILRTVIMQANEFNSYFSAIILL